MKLTKLFLLFVLSAVITTAQSADFVFTPADNLADGFRLHCGPDADQANWVLAADFIGPRPAGVETTFTVTETTIPQGVSVCSMTAYANNLTIERIGDEVTEISPLVPLDFGLTP